MRGHPFRPWVLGKAEEVGLTEAHLVAASSVGPVGRPIRGEAGIECTAKSVFLSSAIAGPTMKVLVEFIFFQQQVLEISSF